MLPFDNKAKKIIIAPLNWGLGHATRCIPIIYHCLNQGQEVIIASDGGALDLLKNEFPKLKTYLLPSYNVTYESNNLWGIVFKNIPNVLSAILKEKSVLKKIVAQENPDVILSDSRFGFRNDKIKSIIISHQLKLQSSSKILSVYLNLVNQSLLNKFDECWVPDFSNRKLTGDLSLNPKIKNTIFINPLTRLKKLKVNQTNNTLIILSGPEPSRTHLEKKLNKILSSIDDVTLIRGSLNLPKFEYLNSNWKIIERADSVLVNRLLIEAKVIISRAGYTSIMDYYILGKEAILIPTPGQTEQEYLGEKLNNKLGFTTIIEKNLDSILDFL